MYLSILLQVVVQNLRMGLLVWSQDVHEGGRGVARRRWGVEGSSAAQGRGQAERSCWRTSMETLLLKRLQTEKRDKRVVSSLFRSGGGDDVRLGGKGVEKAQLPASLCKQTLKYLEHLCCLMSQRLLPRQNAQTEPLYVWNLPVHRG